MRGLLVLKTTGMQAPIQAVLTISCRDQMYNIWSLQRQLATQTGFTALKRRALFMLLLIIVLLTNLLLTLNHYSDSGEDCMP